MQTKGHMRHANEMGIVFDIDHFAVHDGPGIRSVVYLKGCPLACQWCHSPESQRPDSELLFAPSRCANCLACVAVCPLGLHALRDGRHAFVDRDQCTLCGACAMVCPTGALFVCGTRMSADQVAEEAAADQVFYRNSGGGVTLSGGEVLAQAGFARAVLQRLKARGVHTIVETAGYGEPDELLGLARYTDVFYFDLKLMDPAAFQRYVNGDVNVVLSNLGALVNAGAQVVIRVPLIPGITDTRANLLAIYECARRLRIKELHLLPYNQSADAKYAWCDREYQLDGGDGESLSPEQLAALAPEGLNVRIMN